MMRFRSPEPEQFGDVVERKPELLRALDEPDSAHSLRRQVPVSGAATGKEVFFRSLGTIPSVEIEESSRARRFDVRLSHWALLSTPWRQSSPLEAGRPILLADSLDRDVHSPITVITNWETTLKADSLCHRLQRGEKNRRKAEDYLSKTLGRS